MRALAPLFALSLVAGCADPDPCEGDPGVCITARVEGTVAKLDQLRIGADRPSPKTALSPESPRALSLPIRLAISLPAGTTGAVALSAEALLAGVAVARDEKTVTLSGDRAQLTFHLGMPTDLGEIDLLSPDFAVPPDASDVCAAVTSCTAGDGCCPAGCTSASDPDCPVPVCGDGTIQPGERCDDGNLDNGDGCDPTCRYKNEVSLLSGRPGAIGAAESTVGGNARFHRNLGIATDGTSLFVADQAGVIRQVDPITGSTSRIAGAPGQRSTVDDATGMNARFVAPIAIAYLNNTSLATPRKELFVLEAMPSYLFTGQAPTSWQVRKIIVSDPAAPVSTFIGTSTFTGSAVNAIAVAAGATSTSVRVFVLHDGGILQARSMLGGFGSDAPVIAGTALDAAAYGGTPTEGHCYAMAYGGLDGANTVLYLGCPRVLLKVDGGTATVVAGQPKTTATCSDNATATSAVLVHPSGLSVDSTGAVWFFDCGVLKRFDASGVKTMALAGTGSAADSTGTDPKTATPFLANLAATTAIGTTVFVADGIAIRRVDATAVTTFAGKLGSGGVVYSDTNPSFTVAPSLSTDGTSLFSFVYYQRQLFRVALATGASTLLGSLPTLTTPPGSNFAIAQARIGPKLYISYENGEVRQIGTDGSNEQPFAGTAGVTAKITALATDGTNLFYVNAKNVVGYIDPQKMITPLAGVADSTMLQDGTGGGASFAAARDIVYTQGALYLLDGPVTPAGGVQVQTVVRKVELPSPLALDGGVVTTIVGQAGATGAVDAVGAAARFAGAMRLVTDGHSLFVADNGQGPILGDANGPTLRQIELPSFRVTTMLGKRGTWGAGPGVGTAATINAINSIVYDPDAGALYYLDEAAFYRVR